MNCWICGQSADSAEHLVKVSDLRGLFGRVSQERLLYLHSSATRNVPKRTVHDSAFKSKALLCSRCNNALTQPYDRAWECLSANLRARKSLLVGEVINMRKVFKQPVREALLDTHLYFVKLFGCRIVENQVPIEIAQFADALRNRKPHPDVYIAIGPSPFGAGRARIAGLSEIHGVNFGGRCIYATWLYHVGNLAVNVIYTEPGQHRVGLTRAWHPDTTSHFIKMNRL